MSEIAPPDNHVPVTNAEPQSRLEQLGYSQQLERRLSVAEVVGLAMADVSPTMAVLFLSAGVFVVGGTYSIAAALILSVVVVLIALCLAELGAMFPLAGGMYSIVKRVLPGPLAWITVFNYLMQGVVIPASIALGIVGFLKDLLPALTLPDPVVALGLLALVTVVALTKVEVGAWATGVMVIVELIVIAIITAAALLHPHHSVGQLMSHPQMLSNGTLAMAGFGVLMATLAPAFNVINGYDAALGFAEELKGGERKLPKAVVISAVMACVLIVIPLVAALVAAPDLTRFFNAGAPVVYSVQQSLGPAARVIVDIGGIVALLNAMLSMLMYFGRGVYTTGRDNIWPPRISKAFGSLNRFRSPAAGVLTLAIPAAVLLFTSAVHFLIIFTGTMIAAVYFCIGLAGLWSRRKFTSDERPYSMPLWPLPPIVVTAFTALALVEQEAEYLIGEAVLITVALGCWAGAKVWNRGGQGHDAPGDHPQLT
ncbi:APC family permease [Streptomyces sp. NPDC058424]|uniref:APC family permease n=1 Tax=Streptomyces sp. NPDC058424 TaxID=3346491 RepID=UPI0036646BBA